MASMADIREALAANLSALATAKQVSAYRLDNPTPPTLQVSGFAEMEPTTFHGGWTIEMIVQGFVGKTTDKGSQLLLDKWLAPWDDESVVAAIEADKQLGGAVSDLGVSRIDGSTIFTLPNGSTVFGSTWHVQVEI